MKILVAGGLGYIGSHTIVELISAGHKVICVDNLYNAKISVLKNLEKITKSKIKFYKIDCCDKLKLEKVFKLEKPECVIMFQGYKAVGESVKLPLMYYRNNIMSALTILELMEKYNCNNVIFSSSATVYGMKSKSPLSENSNALELNNISNPYGETKAMIEKILTDFANANNKIKVVILRYFNPIGAHNSGLIGEDPNGIPNNLMPYIAKVSTGKLPFLNVFGNDYKTKDGTGVRDYIHVVDLAKGHVAVLKCFKKNVKKRINIYNLGTGKGTSVLELVKAYEKASNCKIKYKIVGRRAGDIDKLYCKPDKICKELGWKTELNILDMCRSSYNFEDKRRCLCQKKQEKK